MSNKLTISLIVVLGSILVSANSFAAQFDSYLINELIAQMQNYADSDCQNEQYFKTAVQIQKELNAEALSLSEQQNSTEPADQLRDSYSGFRKVLLAKMLGTGDSSCSQNIHESVLKLKKLTTVSPDGVSPKSAHQSGLR